MSESEFIKNKCLVLLLNILQFTLILYFLIISTHNNIKTLTPDF